MDNVDDAASRLQWPVTRFSEHLSGEPCVTRLFLCCWSFQQRRLWGKTLYAPPRRRMAKKELRSPFRRAAPENGECPPLRTLTLPRHSFVARWRKILFPQP